MVTARVLLVATALALVGCATPVRAQGPWGPPAASRYSAPAYDEGYRRGVQFGEQDGRRSAPFNFSIVLDYRQGDGGYRSSYGPRNRYRDQFRIGFEAGYRSGYERFGRNRVAPGPPPWSSGRGNAYGRDYGRNDLALNLGYNDGYAEGLKDGRSRHRDNPTAESRYRNGDRGYERWYGARDVYRVNYRRAFIDGYETGYRESWRYR